MHVRFSTLVGCAAAAALALVAPAAHATTSPGPAAGTQHFTGALPDGATWVGDLPANWNGTLVLYSHGFGTLNPVDSPNAATQSALLQEGYALVGSSYAGPSLWAVASAPADQFAALAAMKKLTGRPNQVLAYGTSMGGLISSLEDERANGRLDGALTTCGLLGGGVNLNNYQLDGEYAIARLLAPGQDIKLVDYASPAEASTAAAQLKAAVVAAQQTPEGRARISLAAALLNTPDWFAGDNPPRSAVEQEVQQEQWLEIQIGFVVGARPSIEQAVGGNASWNAGVDYDSLLQQSAQYRTVKSLYRAAGVNLSTDLRNLTSHADIYPDVAALKRLSKTAVPSGRLQVPELTLHTISDQLAPVSFENWYRDRVQQAGRSTLLRQAYVKSIGHCSFSPSEIVAGLKSLQQRVSSGYWPATSAAALNARAQAGGLGAGRFVNFAPPTFVNARGFAGWPRG